MCWMIESSQKKSHWFRKMIPSQQDLLEKKKVNSSPMLKDSTAEV